MQTTFRWQASAWQRPTQKSPGYSTCQPWSSQGTEVPAGAKGRSGQRAQGQLRDVKHEQNKVKGTRPERKGRITGRGWGGATKLRASHGKLQEDTAFCPCSRLLCGCCGKGESLGSWPSPAGEQRQSWHLTARQLVSQLLARELLDVEQRRDACLSVCKCEEINTHTYSSTHTHRLIHTQKKNPSTLHTQQSHPT